MYSDPPHGTCKQHATAKLSLAYLATKINSILHHNVLQRKTNSRKSVQFQVCSIPHQFFSSTGKTSPENSSSIPQTRSRRNTIQVQIPTKSSFTSKFKTKTKHPSQTHQCNQNPSPPMSNSPALMSPIVNPGRVDDTRPSQANFLNARTSLRPRKRRAGNCHPMQ